MDRTFSVEIIISNKPQARDPEGETIIRDLIHKKGLQFVKEVRTGKLLVLKVEASSEQEAGTKALQMCNDLRLYNPIAHAVNMRVSA